MTESRKGLMIMVTTDTKIFLYKEDFNKFH
ncbi:MAG: hypothetical protein IPP72_13630 [Chitinophagaceae bacterium]|nr:hypothetical protein [Chitinophagaceae bacterium]